jgi:hypothetical protein
MTAKSNTQAALSWAEKLDPIQVSTSCSPKHVQSVLEQAVGFIVQLAAQPTPEPASVESLRKDFARECVDTDTLLRLLGFDPNDVRTDGGSLNLQRLANLIEARKAIPDPVAPDNNVTVTSPSGSRWEVDPKWAPALQAALDGRRETVALQGRDELPQLPPRSLLSLWAFISDSELAHIGLKARQKIENRVFELMQIYARSALQAARASLPAPHVGETRFESWLSEHAISDVGGSKLPMYHKQDMRGAYWAGFSECGASPPAGGVVPQGWRLARKGDAIDVVGPCWSMTVSHHDVRPAQSMLYALADAVLLATPQPSEPIAWESTTPVYTKFITQDRFEKLRPEAQRWYKPYRCSVCAQPSETQGRRQMTVAMDTPSMRERVTRLAASVDPAATLESWPQALAFQVEMARALLRDVGIPASPQDGGEKA